MNLSELMKKIVESEETDWHKINCWGAGSGPSYKHRIDVSTGSGDRWDLEVQSHGEVAVFKPDVSITMAWGFPSNDDYQEEWTHSFTDEKAKSDLVDVFYNNALVFRSRYVCVDGARSFLPLPNHDLSVPRSYVRFIELINSLRGGNSEFMQYFKMSNFTITQDPWPEI
jgi:hypothetical protein